MIELPVGAKVVREFRVHVLELRSPDNNGIIRKLKASAPAGCNRTVTGGYDGAGFTVEVRDEEESVLQETPHASAGV